MVINATNKQVAGYKLNNYAMAVNGASTAVDTLGAVPTGVNAAYFGTNVDGTNRWNGWIRKVNYWPQCLINAEVQAFSK